MQRFWIARSLQASAIASALLLVLPAGAQTPVPDTPAPTAAPTTQTTQAAPTAPRTHQRPHRARHHAPAQRHHPRTSNGEPPNASALATDLGATAADYERNAMARCEVFQAQPERKVCTDRLRQAPQGSVQGGGFLREYSYEVPVSGS